jgi:hypothetical protein
MLVSSGIEVPLLNVTNGHQKNSRNETLILFLKKRNFNSILEVEIDAMQQDISKLRDGIDLGVVKQDMGAARIAMLQKELRGAIKQIQDEKYLSDKQGLILAGADRALREILLIFKDDPIEQPLQEATMGVWTKILAEES